MTKVSIGLGSNINPRENLKAAAEKLKAHWPTIRFSPVYQSKAVGYEDQEDFLNAVAVIHTTDSPEEIHTVLREIEATLKKALPFRYGPRTIDLDLLLAGDQVIATTALTVPHPRMRERRFVLLPLVDLIEAEDRDPVTQKTWKELLKATDGQDCQRIDMAL